MNTSARKRAIIATPFAALALGAMIPASAQQQSYDSGAPEAVAAAHADAAAPASPRITLTELTPHLAVNDAAALIEAENYGDAVTLLDDFIANHPEPVAEAFYLLALAHYQLGEYARARPAAERAVTLA